MAKKNRGKVSSKFQNRHIGRIIAFQSLFAYDFEKRPIDDILTFDWIPRNNSGDGDEKMTESDFEWLAGMNDLAYQESLSYAKYLVEGTIRNLSEIDKNIKSKLHNWELGRISAVDRAIVRFATFSILYEDDLDESIVINEAVEIVKEYGSKESYKFVNGILDAIKKDKQKNKRDS